MPFTQTPFMIAVGGSTASGKTTICSKLQARFGEANCLFISCDHYYKDISHKSALEIENTNFDHPDSLDFDLLIEHMTALKNGQSIQMPQYNFKTHAREQEYLSISSKPYIILEGILVLHIETLRSLFDCRIYVDVDPQLAFNRRLQRDILERGQSREQICKQYRESVWPMFQQFVGPSRQFANVVVCNSKNNHSEKLVSELYNFIVNRPSQGKAIGHSGFFAKQHAPRCSSVMVTNHQWASKL